MKKTSALKCVVVGVLACTRYLDEAVVELEAEQRGEDGGVVAGGVLDCGGDHVLGVRARVGVEPHLELPTNNSNLKQRHHHSHRHRHRGSGHLDAVRHGLHKEQTSKVRCPLKRRNARR
jgi:hypothetical protein